MSPHVTLTIPILTQFARFSQARWLFEFPGASGNTATCTLQGFFVQFGVIGSNFFTAFLALQTLLVVRFSWTEKQMQRAEVAFFSTGIGIPLVTAIWAVGAGYINGTIVGESTATCRKWLIC